MDNLTHALAGLLIAEGALVLAGRERPSWRGVACATSILANSLPDFDFLYVAITGGKLGYLLHHRGHTHTLLLAVPQAALLIGLIAAWARLAGRRLDTASWRWLGGLALLGPMLHVVMDGTNSYGVHPFWPFRNHWLYGDAVFIVEPFLWASSVPALFHSAERRGSKALLALILGAGIVLAFGHSLVRPAVAVAFTIASLALVVGLRRVSPARRVITAASAWILVTLAFVAAASRAREAADDALARGFPAARTEDVVLTPLPGDPICWGMIAVQIEPERDRYALRTAALSLAPGTTPPAGCRRFLAEHTAPIEPVTAATLDPAVVWTGQFIAPRAELVDLAGRCHAAAFLRFARAPYWVDRGPDGMIIGDLRYDRDEKLGFAEMRLPGPDEPCPANVPPWIPPRDGLLR